MNDLRILLLPICLLATACEATPAAAPEPPLAGARIGGPFALVDQDGKVARDSDFAGKYRMVYFGYTFCPDVCPVDVAKLMQGYRLFEQADAAGAAKLQPMFITVDPARDTPPVLKEFIANFHPKLIGLTGSAEAIAATAKAHAIYFRKEGDAAAKDYLVSHSNVAYLMGPNGAPIAPLPIDQTPKDIADTFAMWVQ